MIFWICLCSYPHYAFNYPFYKGWFDPLVFHLLCISTLQQQSLQQWYSTSRNLTTHHMPAVLSLLPKSFFLIHVLQINMPFFVLSKMNTFTELAHTNINLVDRTCPPWNFLHPLPRAPGCMALSHRQLSLLARSAVFTALVNGTRSPKDIFRGDFNVQHFGTFIHIILYFISELKLLFLAVELARSTTSCFSSALFRAGLCDILLPIAQPYLEMMHTLCLLL